MGQENYEDFRAAIHDPETIKGMLGDYRAGFHMDHLHDRKNREVGRKLQCPVCIVWSRQDDLEELYRDVMSVWQPWAKQPVTGVGIDCGHHMAEEAPEELAFELEQFSRPSPCKTLHVDENVTTFSSHCWSASS